VNHVEGKEGKGTADRVKIHFRQTTSNPISTKK